MTKAIIAAIATVVLNYGFWVFVTWSPNPAEWSQDMRFVAILLSLAFGAFSAMAAMTIRIPMEKKR